MERYKRWLYGENVLADTNSLEIMLFAITLVIDFSIDIEISI